MQQQQIEQLKKRITASRLLSSIEKQEWLDMAEVMNDKQAADLEAILQTPSPPLQATAPSQATPPLSHISNLPANMSGRQQPAASQKTPQKPAQSLPGLNEWRAKVQKQVVEKELPGAPVEKLLQQNHSQPHRGAKSPVAPKPAATKEGGKPVSQTTVSELPKPDQLSEPLNLQNVPDIAKLTVAQFKNREGSLLLRELQDMVKRSNYFEVLFYLEKSQLYQAYLETGRKALADQKADFSEKGLLTKAEFESFSDLLQQIQIG